MKTLKSLFRKDNNRSAQRWEKTDVREAITSVDMRIAKMEQFMVSNPMKFIPSLKKNLAMPTN